jgi:ribose transport system substrate-binding protein
MRHVPRIALVVVLLLFFAALTMSITTMVSLTGAVATTTRPEHARGRHVSVFLPEQTTLFFRNLVEGVESVASDYDLAVSFQPIGVDAPEFHLARYSGIDGAIVYPYLPEEQMREELEALNEQGIPVVLVEQDVADDWPWTFVGTNNFEMGRRIGAQLAERADHDQIVVVYSDKSPAVAAERELIELGIATALGERLTTPIARRQTGLNPLHAEAVTYQLLRSPSAGAITALVFTDTDDTLAALQAIINLNLVGEVQVIGFGVTEAIIEYLERGVLNATVAVNPQRIGIEAVRVLSELMQTGNAPGYVDTGVEVLRGSR